MSEDHSEVVEIEAIGLEEWDRDRHTPRAMDENLAALVKQSASAQSGPVAAPKLDEGWDEADAAKPRTTTNTLRRTGAAPAIPQDPKRKTQAFGVAVQRPPTAATSAVPKAVPTVQTKPIAREAPKPIDKPVAVKPAATKTSPALTPVATKPAAAPPAAAKTKTSPALTPAAKPAAAPVAPKATKTSPALTPVAKPPAPPATKASAEMAALKPAPATKASAEMAALKSAPATKASAELAALKPATPTTKPSAELAAPKPAAAKAPAKASGEMVAVKPAAPAVRDLPPPKPAATPVAKSSSEMATLKPATPVAKSSSEMATLKAQAKNPMELPAWPPKAEPAYEDWENPNAATSIGNRSTTSPPSGDWDGPRESSVIVDLNAVAARNESPRRAQTSPITQLTSEQGTTTSGAFVMPVAPVGKGSQPETAIAASFETLTTPMAPSAASFETVTAPGLPSAFETVTAPGGARAPTPLPFAFPLAPPPAEPAPIARAHDRATSPELERASSPELGARAAAWQTPLPQALPHAPAPQFPSAAGLDYHGSDAVISAQGARHEPTEPRLARSSLLATVLPTPKSRRFAVIGVAAAVVLILVGFAITSGSKSTPVATQDHHATPAHEPATSPTPPTTPQRAAAAHTRVAVATDTAASSDDTTPRTATPTTRPTPGKKSPAKRRLSRGKKPVVVDYDKQRDPTPDPDQALAQARTAYAAGNQHLFAGEAAAAVTSYRQALAAYPGYVAGYRGLGLAYAQAGDRKAALDAFKTYVKLAPAAKDVALIEKRIRNLAVAH